VHAVNFICVTTSGKFGEYFRMNGNQNNDHLPWLDGLRGIAALWVLLSHVQILSGLRAVPVLSWGGLAVDLFMMLSGFLMAHHYILRRNTEPWDSSRTFISFWVRRFFRIAPLYYVLLIVAFSLGPWLGEYRSAIALVWPDTASLPERYNDQSVANIFAHPSFIFGFLPHFSFRTPLPDWSIGLAMQFYLAFPVIMLVISRIGPVIASLIIIVGCIALQALFPDYFQQFQMPSFLPIKLYVFLIGILIATSREQRSMRTGLFVALLLAALWVYFEKTPMSVARVFMVALMFYLMDNGTLPASLFLRSGIAKIRNYLSSSVGKFLGNTSYAAYLLHLIIVLPVAGELAQFPLYLGLKPEYRFGVCLLVIVPIVYALSWLLYQSVEKNGIQAGKRVLKAINKSVSKPGKIYQTESRGSMKDKLAKGLAWLGAAKVIINILALLSTVVLARLLTPEDFGLVALATTMLAIISAVTELSMASALIHHKDPTDNHFHTAWTLNLSRAVIVGILFCAAAPIAAWAYNEPRLINIMLALSASVVMMGFNNPKMIILTRNLVFWQEFVMTVTQKLAGFLVGIGIAIFYKSYWALIGGTIASQLIGIIVSYIIIPFMPKFSFAHARELWSFSIWLTLGQIINTLNWKLDHLLIGGYLGPQTLGQYSVGDNLAGMPTRETIGPLQTTLFPGFNHIAHDNERLKIAYRSAQSLITAIALPVGVGCALIAHPLVLLGMGEKWLPAVDVIQVLSCVFALQTLSSPVHPLAMAKGETRLLFRRDLLSFAMRVPIIILGMLLGGLLGIIYARSVTGVIAIFINMHLVRRLIGTGIIDQISANMRSLVSVMVMSAGVLSVEYILGGEGTPLFLEHLLGREGPPLFLRYLLEYDEKTFLAIKIGAFAITGAVLYVTVHLILWLIVKKPMGPETEVLRMASKLVAKMKRPVLQTSAS